MSGEKMVRVRITGTRQVEFDQVVEIPEELMERFESTDPAKFCTDDDFDAYIDADDTFDVGDMEVYDVEREPEVQS